MQSNELPILYVKTGCPWCDQARDFLEAHGIEHREVNVSEDRLAFSDMKRKSRQEKAPTLDWQGDILSDFGVDELKEFLLQHEVALEDS